MLDRRHTAHYIEINELLHMEENYYGQTRIIDRGIQRYRKLD